jgi:flavorubredoxin
VSALQVNQICPLHGPILNENLSYYISLYDTWSSYKPETEGVFIAYASIYGNTAKVANEIAEKLKGNGVKVSVADLCRADEAEAIEDAFKYDRMIVAASSYEGSVMPAMYNFLHHLQHKNFQNRKVGIVENGSWAPSAGRVMRKLLEEMKDIEIVSPMVTIRSAKKPADTETINDLVTEMSK